jgi:hypothetical protein
MWKTLITVAVTTGLAAKALRLRIEREEERRAQRRARSDGQAVQRWEDEGGNVEPPSTAASARRTRARSNKTDTPVSPMAHGADAQGAPT